MLSYNPIIQTHWVILTQIRKALNPLEVADVNSLHLTPRHSFFPPRLLSWFLAFVPLKQESLSRCRTKNTDMSRLDCQSSKWAVVNYSQLNVRAHPRDLRWDLHREMGSSCTSWSVEEEKALLTRGDCPLYTSWCHSLEQGCGRIVSVPVYFLDIVWEIRYFPIFIFSRII